MQLSEVFSSEKSSHVFSSWYEGRERTGTGGRGQLEKQWVQETGLEPKNSDVLLSSLIRIIRYLISTFNCWQIGSLF